MSKPSRLEPLADYADPRENEAARRLATSAGNVKAKADELEKLRGYLAGYRQRADVEQHPTGSARWQNARAFLAKLSDAVAFHENELGKAVERHRVETDRWRDSHLRENARQGARASSKRRAAGGLEARSGGARRARHSRNTAPTA